MRTIELLVTRLESQPPEDSNTSRLPPAGEHGEHSEHSGTRDDMAFVHGFDTDRRDLQRAGYALELHERTGCFLLVAGRSVEGALGSEARIDSTWAIQILAGEMSPLDALEHRLGRPHDGIRAAAGVQGLQRIVSRVDNASRTTGAELPRRRLG